MKAKFPGFEENKKGFTGIPDQFFSELLPAISDINELKLVIYLLWSAYKQGDFGTAFTLDSLKADEKMIGGLIEKDKSSSALETSLECAVDDHILIKVSDSDGMEYFFINSPRGRQAAERFTNKGENAALQVSGADLGMIKPNLFQLYVENIGPLTPLIADMLREAQITYPFEWISEALEIAVQNNVRRWKYIETILTRWQEEGRDGTNQRNTEEDYRRYLKGRYGSFGEH
jgi:DnaD/phage-associated family protein